MEGAKEVIADTNENIQEQAATTRNTTSEAWQSVKGKVDKKIK